MILGHVYRVYTCLTNPPKEKIAICVCPETNRFIWINTLARIHGQGQFPLNAGDHSCITHACFANFGQLATFQSGELESAIDHGLIASNLVTRMIIFLNAAPPTTLPSNQFELLINNLKKVSTL